MKIVHFSDPHAGAKAEDFSAYLDKRWVGVFNYTFRRRFKHDLRCLALAVEYILDTKPDVAVCTGDLTSAGQVIEFDKVKPILQPLRDSAIPLIYTPGNHDCYVKNPKCVAAVEQMVDYLTKGNYQFSDLPVVREHGECDFIIFNSSRPSNLLCSWGFVSQSDNNALLGICAKEKTRPRILINHYPLFEDHPILRTRHRLFGGDKIRQLVESGTIDLALCGHIHKPYRLINATGRGECCAGSVTRNGEMTEIVFDGKSFDYKTVELR